MPYLSYLDGSRRQKGDVIRKRADRAAKRKHLRADRAARRAEREASGISGPDIDWGAAINAVADTPIEGLTRTIARGDRQ